MIPVRILVADSRSVTRGVLTALTSSRVEWQVCGEASDGEEAVEKAGLLGPDIVVLDIDLPKLGCLEAVRRIAESHPLQKSIVLITSEQATAVREIFDSGAYGFLLRANVTRDLVLAVENVNSGRTFYSAKAAELVLQDCLEPHAPEEMLTARQRGILNLLAKEFSSALAPSHNHRIPLRPAYKYVAALAVAAIVGLLSFIYAQDSIFVDRSLVSLGLKTTPPQIFGGNPETKVWIDLRTALYYCPGDPYYAHHRNGRFEKQIEAQTDHFAPASRKACK